MFVAREDTYHETALTFGTFENSARTCQRINQIQMPKDLLEALLALLAFPINDEMVSLPARNHEQSKNSALKIRLGEELLHPRKKLLRHT